MAPWFGQAFGTQAFSPSAGRELMPFRSFFSSPSDASLQRRQKKESGQGRRARPMPMSAGSVSARRAGRVKPVLQVGTKLVSGWREMADRLLGATRASFEKGMDHSRRLVEAGSIHEALKLQEQWVRARLNDVLAEGEKVSTLSTKLFGEALRPLVAQPFRS